MTRNQKNSWESKEQAEQRIQTEQLEDQLINAFIAEQEIADWGLGNEAEYDNMAPKEKKIYDLKSYQFFANKQKEKALEYPEWEGIEFDNFLKINRPELDFEKELRSERIGEVSQMWTDVYGSNTNLMKASALRGRMVAIAAAQAQEELKPI